MKEKKVNFIEAHSVEEANNVDLGVYTFIGFNSANGFYAFKIRENERKKAKL